MAASCVILSPTTVAGSMKWRQTAAPAAVTTLCVARPLETASFPSLRIRRASEFTCKSSYGGYGAEAIENNDWEAPPPPSIEQLASEPNDAEEASSSDFGLPVPEARDYRIEAENTKVYVGNLPYHVDSAMLADAFRSVGIDDLVEVNVMYDRMLGKSRGFAFVTLATEEATKLSIEKLDGYVLDGRPLRVNYPQVPRGASGGGFGGGGFGGGFGRQPNPAKCFVGNIPWSVRDEELQEFFSSQGNVVDCRVLTDAETGRSRGIGFVTFSSAEEADAAISSLNGVEFQGRAIRVAQAN